MTRRRMKAVSDKAVDEVTGYSEQNRTRMKYIQQHEPAYRIASKVAEGRVARC